MNPLRKGIAALRTIRPLYTVTAVVVFVVGLITANHFLSSKSTPTSTGQVISHVSVASVSSLSSQTGPLTVVGSVKSLNQASILAQTSGEIVRLSRSIGDHVEAGGVLGEFENSSQRASVTQAEGQYESAQASLAKAQGVTASNTGINSSQAQNSAQNSATALTTALSSLSAALDDAIHAKADTLFINPRSSSPQLQSFVVPDSQLVTTVVNERLALEEPLSTAANFTSSGNLDTNAQAMTEIAKKTQTFLSDLIKAINQAVPNGTFSTSAIAADQATLAAARNEVINAVSGLTAAKNAYDSSQGSVQITTNTATAGTQSDIASAQANVKSARGALDAALSNLGKTIIRSPISGIIVSLPVTQGDFVATFSPVAIVSNPGALYVDAHVTQEDAKTLAVGGKTTIQGGHSGVSTFIAPALDPTTGKIEVKVGIVGQTSGLTDGQAVTISLERSVQTEHTTTDPNQIVIPIPAAKILPSGAVVFTVDASSTLLAIPIKLGTILSNQVVVISGLTPSMTIVTDARGLSTGQTVVVDHEGATSNQ